MTTPSVRAVCWTSLWNDGQGGGLEHLLLAPRSADSVVLAIDDDHGPFRLSYRIAWDERWCVREAELSVATSRVARTLALRADGQGHWRDGGGHTLEALDGCLDLDIWPTPFTNSFPILRAQLAVGERRTFTMAWIDAPALTVQPRRQAYTRLDSRRYLFESVDGTGFRAELQVDEDGLVLDYPGLFARVRDRA